MPRLVAVALAAGAGVAPAVAAEPEMGPAQLEEVKRDLARTLSDGSAIREKADAEAQRLVALKRRLVGLAAKTRRLDRQVAAKEQALERLVSEEAETTAALAARRTDLVRLLAALQRVARHPPAGVLADGKDPLATIRGGLLMRAAVPVLDNEARSLAADLRALASLKRQIAHEREERDKTLRSLVGERKSLVGLIEEKSTIEKRLRDASREIDTRAQRLAAEARSIEQLLARIEATRKKGRLLPADLTMPTNAEPVRLVMPHELPAAVSPLPVVGTIMQRFGSQDDEGQDAQGMTISTRPGAEVVAPEAGVIVFAGPFRGYGRLLIIQHGEAYHILMAGLDRLDAGVGDDVLAGEPVGAMGSIPGKATHLYIELRQSGRPINPLPWLVANRNKVSG